MNLFEKFLTPAPLPYDFQEWKQLDFAEKAKKVCQAWAIQGYGSPIAVAIFYLLKIAFYIYIWLWFCSFSTNLGSISDIGTWWFELEALGKFIFWTTLIEVIGFGGASGPLTGRYVPILGGITYFLRPNTIKVPLFPNVPIIGSDNRTWIDTLLYLTLLCFLVNVCIAPSITPEIVLPIVVLLPICGILDRTVYLAARGDIYYPMIVCFLFPAETGHALKIIWFGIWFWAAFSKLTPNFISVITVMISNSVLLNASIFDGFKKRLFRSFPYDLRPSRFAGFLAHFGTLVEFSMPFLLLTFMGNSQITFYALIAISMFHLFIFLNFPMGVPMEWNIIMVFGAWMLFYGHTEFNPMLISEPIVGAMLAIVLIVLPIVGNLFPKHVSFLISMRYYAGTWAYSIWLFKGDAKERIDQKITKTSKDLTKQLLFMYDRETAEAILSRMIAFRLMHLPGRLLNELISKAVDNINAYQWVEGEIFAGEVVGWNFGDGHLHHEPVLASIQKRCNYDSGELRVIMVESPQFHTQKLEYRIYDAKDGLIEKGFGNTKELQQKMPWGEKALNN
ncbi:MAG: DUF3556 domain-containing protein [Chitinophagales bacterium]